MTVWAVSVMSVQSDGTMRRSGTRPIHDLRLVTAGEGMFRCGGEDYVAGPGSLFALYPGVPFEFHDDPESPWGLFVLQMIGSGVETFLKGVGLSRGRPVAHCSRLDLAVRRFELLHEYYGLPEKDPWRASGLFFDLASALRAEKAESAPGPQDSLVRRATYLTSALLETGIGVNDLSRMLHVSRSTLNRAFQKDLRLPVVEFLRNARVQRAKQLLTGSDEKMSAVAFESGFRQEKYFYRCFKEATGLTPVQWRERGDS